MSKINVKEFDLFKSYADENLYNRCENNDDIKNSALMALYSRISLIHPLPSNITPKNIDKVNYILEQKGFDLSKIVNETLKKAADMYDERQKKLKSPEFQQQYAEYSKDWQNTIVD